MSELPFTVRIATPADADAVTNVLQRSYGSLLAGHYDAALLARAMPLMTKANPVLMASGKYHVAETGKGEVVGCGGWSLERPGTKEIVGGLGHIRHFATDPAWNGRGVAKAILVQCFLDAESQAVFTMEAYATLAAMGFYRALGFSALETIEVSLAPGVVLPSIRMIRRPGQAQFS